MDSWGTILLGYAIVFGTVCGYAYSVVRRGRILGEGLGLGSDGVTHHQDEPQGDGPR